MLIVNRKLRTSSPFTLGNKVIFQSFGVDVIKSCARSNTKELKKSSDFVGYSAQGEYSSATYNRNNYVLDENTVFTSNEVFDVEFEDTDDISVL